MAKRKNLAIEKEIIAILKMNGNKVKFQKETTIPFYNETFFNEVALHIDEVEYNSPTDLSSFLGVNPIIVRGHFTINGHKVIGTYTRFSKEEQKHILSALQNEFTPFIMQ